METLNHEQNELKFVKNLISIHIKSNIHMNPVSSQCEVQLLFLIFGEA